MIAMLRQLSTRDQYDTDINNYRLPYDLQQRAKPIPHTQFINDHYGSISKLRIESRKYALFK